MSHVSGHLIPSKPGLRKLGADYLEPIQVTWLVSSGAWMKPHLGVVVPPCSLHSLSEGRRMKEKHQTQELAGGSQLDGTEGGEARC